MKYFLKLIILTLALSNFGCGNFLQEKAQEDNKFLAIPGGETDLTFEIVRTKVFEPHCITCHTGRHSAYKDYQVVKLAAEQIVSRITTKTVSRRMPKGRPELPQDLQRLVIEWVAAGAPEFGSNNEKPIGNDEENILYSFADVKENVFRNNQCLQCHSHFNDYDIVRKNLGSILSFVQDDKMPYPSNPSDSVIPVSKEQKKIISQWVSQGAPEFVGVEPNPIVDKETELNWLSIRNNILGPKCILCHNSYGKRGPTFMATYKDLTNWFAKSPELFNFETPNESHFVGAIIGRVDDDEFFFDPMPFNREGDDVSDIEPITKDELNIIKQWIKLGIPEE